MDTIFQFAVAYEMCSVVSHIIKYISPQNLTVLTPEIDCDKTAMDLPSVTSAVVLLLGK
jgi:hypothetical protein